MIIEQNSGKLTFPQLLFTEGIQEELEYTGTVDVLLDGNTVITISIGIYNAEINQITTIINKNSDFNFIVTLKDSYSNKIFNYLINTPKNSINYNTIKQILDIKKFNLLSHLKLNVLYVLPKAIIETKESLKYLTNIYNNNFIHLPIQQFIKINNSTTLLLQNILNKIQNINSGVKTTNSIELVDCDIINLTFMTIYDCTFIENNKQIKYKITKTHINTDIQSYNQNSQKTPSLHCSCYKKDCEHIKALKNYLRYYNSLYQTNTTDIITLNNFVNKLKSFVKGYRKELNNKPLVSDKPEILNRNIEQQYQDFINTY
ncbi:hypothetical protein DEFDS_P196 (plasmid) [Deferribacter desulfuricans SSM1]|uniref:Uncharacterized protein n=1 Tax=Deferribacter desulfuricans (strain DSM 14783 / JCM 11476 / NBRC 101012 / SSM1) TaxID=639282 RepID=D3PF24_DEFDS|nr:hypothetical protein [Deferribacter desulfuricans]BAI81816.1 hypothetical protein DEFDS_P196 [Deferribacter desulfuricans SSM1]